MFCRQTYIAFSSSF